MNTDEVIERLRGELNRLISEATDILENLPLTSKELEMQKKCKMELLLDSSSFYKNINLNQMFCDGRWHDKRSDDI